MRINKHDTNGTKPLLSKGELGYDDYAAGGDTGRVYVGTGTENIALAERLESNMMSKAEFNALAEERKANRAGSGFEVPNSNTSQNAYWVNVQNGIKASTGVSGSASNQFAIGGLGDANDIVEKIVINGVNQNIGYVASPTKRLYITLPTAPNIYPHDTVLTPEQIASGVIKHADASNSGLIVNGKFDTDTAWTKATGWSISEGQLLGGAGANGASSHQSIATVIGKKYIVEYVVASITGTLSTRVTISNDISGTVGTKDIVAAGRYTFEFTATANTHYLHFTDYCTSVAIDNIAVYPVDAISRSDLVFLESWHEDISEKNIVYPLGNVQYLGGNTDGLTGIANGSFTGFETYSLFGNWQAPSALIGKGYVWSSLTEAQKRAFIANAENNCYLDGDKVIQVRYRVRVVQGLTDEIVHKPYNNYLNESVSGLYVKPKGKKVLISSDRGISDTDGVYGHGTSSWVASLPYANEFGVFSASSRSGSTTGFIAGSYNGQCFALPLTLISRRNQGMYHNAYNPNGTKLASDGLDCFTTTISFNSISDCFDPAKLLTNSGSIASGVSGRPD